MSKIYTTGALGAMLLALMLAGCSNEGPELTTEEYADALEEATSRHGEEIEAATEAAAEDLFSGALVSSDEEERWESLETSDSWSEEDGEFASDLAETVLRANVRVVDVAIGGFHDYLDEVSNLNPPDDLADLHGNFIATLQEQVRFAQEQMEEMVNGVDTEIKNREDLDDFWTSLNSLGAPSSPEMEEQVEDLAEQAEEACLELELELEWSLERDVDFCSWGWE